MELNQVRKLLKTVWQKCEGKGTTFGDDDCTTYATHQIVYVNEVTKKLKTSVTIVAGLDYKEEDNLIQGHYCQLCGKIKIEYIKNLFLSQTVELRPIFGVEEALKIIGEKGFEYHD